MINIKNLKIIGDVLSSEGSILSLFLHNQNYYLTSYLSDGSGTIYYSVQLEHLKQYLRSAITLKELYLMSEDVLIVNKFRNVETIHTKEDFVDRVQCGDSYFNKFGDDMANIYLSNQILNW